MYYAIHKGNKIGIFNTWLECSTYVNKYKGAIYKKFKNIKDAKYFVKYGKTNYIEEIVTDNLIVYTDGSCINNGTKDARAGIGVYFGKDDDRNVSRAINGKQTNNTAEIKAIIEVYNILKKNINTLDVTICSDSVYAINSCVKRPKNKKICNYELVNIAYNTFKNLKNVTFQHVKAHTKRKDIHSLGNREADKLAGNSNKD